MTNSSDPLPKIIPYPDAVDVFAGDVDAHRRVLQPLVSIDASQIDPSWKGWLHIVTPLEPYDGLVGDETSAFHSGYCVSNWIAFTVSASRYTFQGDFRYFLINSTQGDSREFYEKDYQEKEESYAAHLERFRADGQRGADPSDWCDQIGGDAPYGNWCAFGLPVEEGVDREGRTVAYPLTRDGRRFRFVASLTGFMFRQNCADGILLFFDPQTSTAVITFDWT